MQPYRTGFKNRPHRIRSATEMHHEHGACGLPPRLLSLCLLNQRAVSSQHMLKRPPGHTRVPFLCTLP